MYFEECHIQLLFLKYCISVAFIRILILEYLSTKIYSLTNRNVYVSFCWRKVTKGVRLVGFFIFNFYFTCLLSNKMKYIISHGFEISIIHVVISYFSFKCTVMEETRKKNHESYIRLWNNFERYQNDFY